MSIHNSIARKKWGYGKGLNSTTAMSIGNPRFCGRVGVGVRYEKKKNTTAQSATRRSPVCTKICP